MDGPNIEKLFTETDCLTVQSNLKDIVQYLRFFKNEDSYQTHLRKYLPKLAVPEAKEAFDEFIGDYADKEKAKELIALVTPKKEEKKVKVPDNAATEDLVVEKKKPGRKPKIL